MTGKFRALALHNGCLTVKIMHTYRACSPAELRKQISAVRLDDFRSRIPREGSEDGRTPGPRHFGRRRPRPKLYQHNITVCYRQLGNLVQFEKSPLPAPGGTVSGDLAGEPDRIPCFVRATQALGEGGGREELSISVQTWGSGGDPLGIQRGSGTF